MPDLTTLFVDYLDFLREDFPVEADTTTLVAKDLPFVREGASVNNDDLNTAYLDYLT